MAVLLFYKSYTKINILKCKLDDIMIQEDEYLLLGTVDKSTSLAQIEVSIRLVVDSLDLE